MFGFMGYLNNGIEARFENAFPETSGKAARNQWPDEAASSGLEGFHESCVAYASAVEFELVKSEAGHGNYGTAHRDAAIRQIQLGRPQLPPADPLRTVPICFAQHSRHK